MDFIEQYINESIEILQKVSREDIEGVVNGLAKVREGGGRLYILGVGGSAATASHFVNDLRKIAGIDAYTPVDNVAELTARTNDEGWESTFVEWLRVSKLGPKDGVFILSVGGGDLEHNISPNLVRGIELAKEVGAGVYGFVGRTGGYTAKVADACVIVPTVNDDHITPHTESFHSLLGHIIVSHPRIKIAQTKWESAVKAK